MPIDNILEAAIKNFIIHTYGQLSSCCLARGFGTRLTLVGPTKVKAFIFFNSLKLSLVMEIKKHLLDYYFLFSEREKHFFWM